MLIWHLLLFHWVVKQRQASVALNLQPKQTTENTDPSQHSKIRKTNESTDVASINPLMQIIRKEVADGKANEKATTVEEMQTNADEGGRNADKVEEAMDITPAMSPTKENVPLVPEEHAEEEDDDNGEVHIVSYRPFRRGNWVTQD